MCYLFALSLLGLSITCPVALAHKRTGTIADVEHVVLFMQENHSFDNYFGSMAGVRGFADPNIAHASNGREVWYQKVDSKHSNATTELLPFYVGDAGGNQSQASQCMTAGSNGWQANHNALDHGNNNRWVVDNTPYSWSYFKRPDIPTHFALADHWTTADMYSEGVIASTHPNRAFWGSGSINVPGGPQDPDEGGVLIDNNGTPGCESTNPNVNCFPLKWKTFPEYLEDANVTWQVYQGTDNFGDNMVAYFDQFINAPNGSALATKGMSFLGLQAFYDAAAAGTLPQVSYIIGPGELSEHPPRPPSEGAWLQQQVVNAVIHGPKYASTVLMISYDETGGFGDHVIPITAPKDTPGEWMTNPFNTSETLPAGPGFRLPFTCISPYCSGGHVYTGHADHSSQIMFIEKWLASKGKNVFTHELNSWRREHMSDLTDMFDFAHPDYSIPHLPVPPPPPTNSAGQYIGTATCQANFPNAQPPVPYGNQTREISLSIETGFKTVRGALTEGRYLVFESKGRALALSEKPARLGVVSAVPSHDTPMRRFVLHATAPPPATNFNLQFSTNTGSFVDSKLRSTGTRSKAATFKIKDLGSGQGYTLQEVASRRYLSISGRGDAVSLEREDRATKFKVYSVTKSTDSGKGF